MPLPEPTARLQMPSSASFAPLPLIGETRYLEGLHAVAVAVAGQCGRGAEHYGLEADREPRELLVAAAHPVGG